MWAMYKSSRELIKMQDFQKLGKLATAAPICRVLAVQCGRDSTLGGRSRLLHHCPRRQDSGLDCPLRRHPHEGP